MKASKSKHLRKAYMWYKVKELTEKGLNKSQISLEIGIHRKTVRKYLKMSEEEFFKWLEHPKKLPKKLNDYYDYVRKLLEKHQYLSAAQVEDRLKEDYPYLPAVHSKTIYNFVQMSNFYTLPVGTYRGPETVVMVKENKEDLLLYTTDNSLGSGLPSYLNNHILL
jgi:transposase